MSWFGKKQSPVAPVVSIKSPAIANTGGQAPAPPRRPLISNRRFLLIFAIMFAMIGGYIIIKSFAASPECGTPGSSCRLASFDTDPHWQAQNNLPTADSLACQQVSFNFGYNRSTNYPGKIGGNFVHSTAYKAYYAKTIAPKTLNDSLDASGTLVVPSRIGGDFSFGWFNHDTSKDWRASDSLVFHAAGPPDTSLAHVSIRSTGYAPSAPIIRVGDTVEWINDDTANHQIVLTGIETSPDLAKGAKYRKVFPTAGTYVFHDAANPAITGSVTVVSRDFFQDYYSAFAIVGTRNSLSNGTKASTLANVDAYKFGQTYNWHMHYDLNGGPDHHGTLTLTVGDNTGSIDLDPEVRADGANFDRFGFLATQAPAGGANIDAYIDSLVIDGAPALTFNSDPGWEGYNNLAGAAPDHLPGTDCHVTNRQDFKYVKSNEAGGAQPGEIGGGLWPQPPAYYADTTISPISLNDTLYATGKIALKHETLDSDLWIGWFSAGNNGQPNDSIRKYCRERNDSGETICHDKAVYDMMSAHIGGPTHYGYRFSPQFRNNTPDGTPPNAMGDKKDANIDASTPVLNSHGAGRTFWICYVPNINSKGDARLTTGLSADPSVGINSVATSSKVIPKTSLDNATFNRFGVISASTGGKVVEIYLDDLRYTVAPGDQGPDSQCGTAAPPSTPTLNFNANPGTINSGSSSKLTWSSTNTATCTANDGWTGTKATNGSSSTGNLSSTTTYTLSCTGPGGSVTKSATVTVNSTNPPPPTPSQDLPIPARFNSPSHADAAIYRPSGCSNSDCIWSIQGAGTFSFGHTSDKPVPADYNGDGRADIAVYRNGDWHISAVGDVSAYGIASDKPVPADYNGDGRADIAVYRNGDWHIRNIGDFTYGQPGDIPVPADYNGDGRADIAVYRPSDGTWHVRAVGDFLFGNSSDVPVPADYNGDGQADIAVFRQGDWHIRAVGDYNAYGTNGDVPVPADYNGDGRADAAIYRPSTRSWHVRNVGDFKPL